MSDRKRLRNQSLSKHPFKVARFDIPLRKKGEEEKEETVTLDSLPHEIIAHLIFPFMRGWAFVTQYVCNRWRAMYADMKNMIKESIQLSRHDPVTPSFLAWTYHIRKNPILTDITAYKVLSSGHIEDYNLSKYEFTITKKLSKWIAKEGSLEGLIYIKKRKWPFNKSLSQIAARGGHLDMLEWARENGCPWDEQTCQNAAFGGHLSVLKWAREHGCPWNEYTCSFAA